MVTFTEPKYLILHQLIQPLFHQHKLNRKLHVQRFQKRNNKAKINQKMTNLLNNHLASTENHENNCNTPPEILVNSKYEKCLLNAISSFSLHLYKKICIKKSVFFNLLLNTMHI